MTDVEGELVRRRDLGQPVVLATVVSTGGKPPSRPGNKVLLDATGQALAGTLGCSEFDAAVRADAPSLLTAGVPALRTYTHEEGTIEVYLEPYTARPLLVVLGATPVAAAILGWAPALGFATLTLVDEQRIAGRDFYLVHTDHDAPDLVDDLALALRHEPRLVGVMGSRRHTGHHLEELRRRGVDEALVAAVQSPVGLEIGALSAPEIALSILAGLVAARHGAAVGWKAARRRGKLAAPLAPPSGRG